jgi:Domain of unknown function (DUF4292)
LKIKHLVYLLVVIIAACKTSKQAVVTTPIPTNAALSVNAILSRLSDNEIKADWMSGNAGVDYSGKPMSISVSTEVRFRRDSVIWMNIKKLGILNLARVKITRDSVFILNNINSNYIAKDFKYIEEKFGIPANFDVLQDILLGNPIFLTDKEKLKMERNGSSSDIVLRGSNDQWQTGYHLDATTLAVKEMLFEQPISARMMKITYSEFQPLRGYKDGKTIFSYLRTINVESPQTGKAQIVMEVDADDLEVNIPKSIKFDIPAHYDKVD